MKTHRAIAVIALGFAASCATNNPTRGGDADSGSHSGAKVEIVAEGGIAALLVTHRVDHDTRAFAYTQGRLCGASCPAPTDSASGMFSPSTTDSLFNVVVKDAGALSRDDYGITRNGADMMSYTIRITTAGRVRTIHADDGTLPDAARQIIATVRETISAARGR
ncbi:MAG TPA: hypothetical protein VGM50_20145 [Gemmatimonadaceae bacterium]